MPARQRATFQRRSSGARIGPMPPWPLARLCDIDVKLRGLRQDVRQRPLTAFATAARLLREHQHGLLRCARPAHQRRGVTLYMPRVAIRSSPLCRPAPIGRRDGGRRAPRWPCPASTMARRGPAGVDVVVRLTRLGSSSSRRWTVLLCVSCFPYITCSVVVRLVGGGAVTVRMYAGSWRKAGQYFSFKAMVMWKLNF